MNSFGRAMKGLSPGQQKRILRVLGKWSTTTFLGHIVPNLKSRERFLPFGHMKEILLAVQKSQGVDLVAIAQDYKAECHNHALKGGRVRLKEMPILLGKAVEKDLFTNHLIGLLNGSRSQAEDLVTRLLVNDQLSEKESVIPMSLYAMWSTWNEIDSAGDPFSFSKEDAGFVRACLGLNREHRIAQGLLLFTYTLGSRHSLFRPTVADAELHPYFMPPAIGFDDHGWTNPILPTSTSPMGLPVARPEAIHKRQPLSALRGRTRLLV